MLEVIEAIALIFNIPSACKFYPIYCITCVTTLAENQMPFLTICKVCRIIRGAYFQQYSNQPHFVAFCGLSKEKRKDLVISLSMVLSIYTQVWSICMTIKKHSLQYLWALLKCLTVKTHCIFSIYIILTLSVTH